MTLIKCPECGKQYENDEKFCGDCGTSLNSELSKFLVNNKRSLLYKKLVDNHIYSSRIIDEADIENIDDVYVQADNVDGRYVKHFYYVEKENLSLDEVKIELMMKHQETMNTIKNILIFFTILTIIGVLCTCYEVYQYMQIFS